MSARLQSILADAMVATEIQDAMAQAGLLTVGLFAAMGSTDQSVKEFLADVVDGLDPVGIPERTERAKVRMLGSGEEWRRTGCTCDERTRTHGHDDGRR